MLTATLVCGLGAVLVVNASGFEDLEWSDVEEEEEEEGGFQYLASHDLVRKMTKRSAETVVGVAGAGAPGADPQNQYDNHLLVSDDEGKEWCIRDGNGTLSRIDLQGDSIVYAKADDELWYRFKNPPQGFKEFIYQLPRQFRDMNATASPLATAHVAEPTVATVQEEAKVAEEETTEAGQGE